MFIKDLETFKEALSNLIEVRGMKREVVIEAIKAGIVAAFNRSYGAELEIEVDIDDDFNIYINVVKEVVESVENPDKEISLEEAKEINSEAAIGDEMLLETLPEEFKRGAIQNAKQTILYKIREAERASISEKFDSSIGSLFGGKIRRVDGFDNVFVDLDGVETLLGKGEQSPLDSYKVGEQLKVLIVDVLFDTKFPKVMISRKRAEFVAELFKFEIPEIENGLIKIESVTREAGFRTKIAVSSNSEALDIIGACVGNRSSRIKAIINELSGEKIDIVLHSENPAEYIENALKPARISSIDVDEENRVAKVKVAGDQLAIAIGKKGQNIRLASKLTGYRIEVGEL